jgi:hypothetical protein
LFLVPGGAAVFNVVAMVSGPIAVSIQDTKIRPGITSLATVCRVKIFTAVSPAVEPIGTVAGAACSAADIATAGGTRALPVSRADVPVARPLATRGEPVLSVLGVLAAGVVAAGSPGGAIVASCFRAAVIAGSASSARVVSGAPPVVVHIAAGSAAAGRPAGGSIALVLVGNAIAIIPGAITVVATARRVIAPHVITTRRATLAAGAAVVGTSASTRASTGRVAIPAGVRAVTIVVVTVVGIVLVAGVSIIDTIRISQPAVAGSPAIGSIRLIKPRGHRRARQTEDDCDCCLPAHAILHNLRTGEF